MRHNKKNNHLGRTHSHRAAMLSNMAASLILHKRIFTTTAKAKSLRKYVEPLITKSKESSRSAEDVMHSRRIVFASLQNKYAVKELFSAVAEKVGDRPGGYTRIIKTGNRLGDNAAMCFIELVDFNENMLKDTKKAATKTRRSSRRSGKKTSEATTAVAAAPVVEETKEAIVAAAEPETELIAEVQDETPVAEAELPVEAEVQAETVAVEEEEKKDAE
jgi:large subunit ribosomal protein L17